MFSPQLFRLLTLRGYLGPLLLRTTLSWVVWLHRQVLFPLRPQASALVVSHFNMECPRKKKKQQKCKMCFAFEDTEWYDTHTVCLCVRVCACVYVCECEFEAKINVSAFLGRLEIKTF